MKRRDVIGGLPAVALSPRLTVAAVAPLPIVGLLNGGSSDAFRDRLASIKLGLAEVGFVDGNNISLVSLWADGRYDKLPNLAADIVAKGPSVIVATGGASAALAAKGATTTIPIVFVIGSDPVGFGLVKSLSQPGGNATGVSVLSATLAPKRLEVLREMVARVDLIALLINSEGPVAEIDRHYTEDAAKVFGQRLIVLSASNNKDLDAAFETIVRVKADALVVGSDGFFTDQRLRLSTFAASRKIPAIYHDRAFVVAGGLVSYGASLNDAYRQAGNYVGRILHGARPAEMPVEYPTKFELVINLKAATALGLSVPPALIARADELIE